jgi:hypothetical protein
MKPLFYLVALGLFALSGPRPAFAQEGTFRPERPYRGLFGGGGTSDLGQSLTANAALAGGYDDNILTRRSGQAADPRVARSGVLGQGSGSLRYSLGLSRFNAGATVGASSRYYPSLPSDFVNSYVGSAGASVRLLNSPAVNAHQDVSYRPYTFGRVLPVGAVEGIGIADAPDLDLVIAERQYLSYSGGLDLNQGLSRRSSFNLSYNYQVRNSLADDRRYLHQNAAAGYRHSLSRDLTLRAGYGYGVGRYQPLNRRVESHDIDLGVDYSRALSFSRRTQFSFGTGTAATGVARSRTDLDTSETRDGSRTRFHATGHAQLTHEIGRTWHASIAYERGVRFSDVLDEPVSGQSALAGFGGLFNRRLQFQSTARALFRGEGVGSGHRFDIYQGAAALSYALTRYVSMGLNYSYYRYRFGSGVLLPTDVPRSIDRQSLRAQVSVWAPLFQRARTPNATR